MSLTRPAGLMLAFLWAPLGAGMLLSRQPQNCTWVPGMTVYHQESLCRLHIKLLEVKDVPFPKEADGWLAMMFVGGMRHEGRYRWVSRLFERSRDNESNTSENWKGWENVSWYDHSVLVQGSSPDPAGPIAWDMKGRLDDPKSQGLWVGIEDPRIDRVQDRLFALATTNFDKADQRGCNRDTRHTNFVPLNNPSKMCLIRVNTAGLHPCEMQKNWVPLVLKNSSNIFIVYSVVPFQVLRFNETSCSAKLVSGDRLQRVNATLYRSGSRYVHAFDVPGGAVYWSLGHTGSSTWYRTILLAVLVKDDGFGNYTFERLGISRPFFLKEALEGRGDWIYTHSILDYDPEKDVTHIAGHISDWINLVMKVQGITPWLRDAYEEHVAKQTK